MCKGELSSIQLDIEDRLGAKVSLVETDINPSSPFNVKQKRVSIRLASATLGASLQQNSAGRNIVSSPALKKSYAMKLLSSCDDVAEVVFRFYEDNIGWYMYPDGQVRRSRCLGY